MHAALQSAIYTAYTKVFHSLFPHGKDLQYRKSPCLPEVLLKEFVNTHFFLLMSGCSAIQINEKVIFFWLTSRSRFAQNSLMIACSLDAGYIQFQTRLCNCIRHTDQRSPLVSCKTGQRSKAHVGGKLKALQV